MGEPDPDGQQRHRQNPSGPLVGAHCLPAGPEGAVFYFGREEFVRLKDELIGGLENTLYINTASVNLAP
jgi:hypothetical protein